MKKFVFFVFAIFLLNAADVISQCNSENSEQLNAFQNLQEDSTF